MGKNSLVRKAKNARYFKGTKRPPCRYRGQAKIRMDSEIFKEWIQQLDQNFETEVRKIALIIHNCLAHPVVENLKSIDFSCPRIQQPFTAQWFAH